MSKFTKLIKSPKLFFLDAFKKSVPKKSVPKKSVPKKSVPKKSVPTLLIKADTNIFSPIKLVLHTGEKQGALAHLNIWIQCFEATGVPYIILTRHLESYEEIIKKYSYLKNIIYVKSHKDIEDLFALLPLVKACFYPSNTGNNIHLLFENNIKHIFIGHGDSDKTASAHKFFRVYDENWVAGEAHIDRFKNSGFNFSGLKFIKIGRPNLYNVIRNTQLAWRNRYNGKINLLYLPTWEGTYKEQDYSSLTLINENINQLISIDKLKVNLKLHPFTGNRNKELLDIQNNINNQCRVIAKTETVDSIIEKSNIFICDISAVVSECLAANAPIFIYIPTDKEVKISQSNMPYNKYCYSFSTTEELIEKISIVLDGDDYLKDERDKASMYILNKDATLNKSFEKEILKIGEKNGK